MKYYVRAIRVEDQLTDPLVKTEADARAILDGVAFLPNLAGILGEVREREVAALFEKWNSPVMFTLGGWLLSWRFGKVDVCGSADPFAYCVSAYVPDGVRRSRALELVFDRFRCFLEHELREGFTFDGQWKPFDPHPRRTT